MMPLQMLYRECSCTAARDCTYEAQPRFLLTIRTARVALKTTANENANASITAKCGPRQGGFIDAFALDYPILRDCPSSPTDDEC